MGLDLGKHSSQSVISDPIYLGCLSPQHYPCLLLNSYQAKAQ